MLELYENIKKERKKLKLTQTELAKRLGYADKSMIAKIEKGQVDLSQSKIIAFAEALETTPGNLMGWEEDKQKNNRNYRTITTSTSRTMYDSIHFGLINDYFGDNAIYNKLIEALEEYKEDEELLNDTYDYFNFLIEKKNKVNNRWFF